MHRSLIVSLLLAFNTLSVNAAEFTNPARPAENLEEISERNRAWWHWRRCIHKYEQAHGPSKDGKSPQLCGEEPQHAALERKVYHLALGSYAMG